MKAEDLEGPAMWGTERGDNSYKKIYVFDCPNPKGHFGYGHSGICYFPVGWDEIAVRTWRRYTADGSDVGVYEAVIDALRSFMPPPHPDAGYSEPVRD